MTVWHIGIFSSISVTCMDMQDSRDPIQDMLWSRMMVRRISGMILIQIASYNFTRLIK
jgi:hypothetical protein